MKVAAGMHRYRLLKAGFIRPRITHSKAESAPTASFSVHTRPVSASANASQLHDEGVSDGGAGAQELYAQIEACLKERVAPRRADVRQLLRSCAGPADVELALSALRRVRHKNAVVRKQTHKYSPEVAEELVRACIRAGAADKAMAALEKSNPLGLTFTPHAAQLLLADAVEAGDLPRLQGIVRRTVAAGLRPSCRTAGAALEACQRAGDVGRLLRLGGEFHTAGVALGVGQYDLMLTSAANAGRAGQVLEVQAWREARGFPHTPASRAALVKALILKHKVEEAAQLLASKVEVVEEPGSWWELRTWAKQLPKDADGESKPMAMEALETHIQILEATLKVDARSSN